MLDARLAISADLPLLINLGYLQPRRWRTSRGGFNISIDYRGSCREERRHWENNKPSDSLRSTWRSFGSVVSFRGDDDVQGGEDIERIECDLDDG
jgi:hypothetical protein